MISERRQWRCVGAAAALTVALAAGTASGAGSDVADAATPTLQAFALPPSVSSPVGAMQDALTVGPDGREWFAVDPGEDNVDYRLVAVDAAGTFTVLPADLGAPGETTSIGELIADGDSVWALSKANSVFKIDSTGQLTRGQATLQGGISDMTLGPDGNLYLTQDGSRIDRLVPGQDTLTPIQAPSGIEPDGIVTLGNRLFFSDSTRNGLWSMTTDGAFTGYDVTLGPAPHAMTDGPDGDLWTVGQGVDGNPGTSIERVDPTTGAVLGTYTPPQSAYVLSLAAGPDGRIWFPEAGLVHGIGALDPATGALTSYALPAGFDVTPTEAQTGTGFPPATHASTIAPGPGGTLWVTGQTEAGAPAIVEISQLTGSSTGGPGGGSSGSGSGGPARSQPTHRRTARIVVRVEHRPDRGGRLVVLLRCLGPQACRGRLTMTATVRRAGRRARPTLAAAGYRLGAGHHHTVRTRLSPEGRRLLAAAGRRGLHVTLHVAPSNGRRRSSSLVLRPAARATRHRR